MRVPGNGDIRHRRRVRRAQVDAGGGLAGICGQVKPADLVRRVRAQQQLARCHLAAPGDLVADPAVICCGYGERAGWPVGRDEPRAARGLHISHDKHVAAAVVVPDLDHLTHRHDLPRCAPEGRLDASGAGAAGNEPAPAGDGKTDVGLDLVRDVGADSAHGSQCLRDQCEPRGMPPGGNADRRHRHRAA